MKRKATEDIESDNKKKINSEEENNTPTEKNIDEDIDLVIDSSSSGEVIPKLPDEDKIKAYYNQEMHDKYYHLIKENLEEGFELYGTAKEIGRVIYNKLEDEERSVNSLARAIITSVEIMREFFHDESIYCLNTDEIKNISDNDLSTISLKNILYGLGVTDKEFNELAYLMEDIYEIKFIGHNEV